MKKINLFILTVAAAITLAACGAPADNKPANVNTNTNTNSASTSAAPTADALLDMEKKASEAYAKGDGAYFEGMLSDKAIMSMGKEHRNKAAIVSMIKTAKCEMKDGVKLSEPQVAKIDNDTYAFTYKNETAGTCTEGGKSKEMKPMRASTVWVRNGSSWQAVWHGETAIMAAPGTDTKDEAKKDEPKKDDMAASEAKKDEKAAAPKKDEKAAAPMKDEKAAAPMKDEKPAANAAAPAEPAKMTTSANTEALAKLHAAGWEAFRNKDAKAFDAMLTPTFVNVGPDGTYTGSKADVIKMWTETMKCEGVTKTSFTDTFAQAISPTVEILMGKGKADGKCDGRANADLWQTAVYVKEGDAWKLAYMFESAGM